MTQLDYEDLYREAIVCLSQTCEVGEPFLHADGTRVCEICGQLLNDNEVLERWWGKNLAELIKSVGRSPVQRQPDQDTREIVSLKAEELI